jgi:hypothetical protein
VPYICYLGNTVCVYCLQLTHDMIKLNMFGRIKTSLVILVCLCTCLRIEELVLLGMFRV